MELGYGLGSPCGRAVRRSLTERVNAALSGLPDGMPPLPEGEARDGRTEKRDRRIRNLGTGLARPVGELSGEA